MIRNKVEIELLKTDTGKLRIIHGGGSALVPDTWDNIHLIPFLEVALLSSLGISSKMNFKMGERVVYRNKFNGTITAVSNTEIDVVVKMDDDGKELLINRKDLEYEN